MTNPVVTLETAIPLDVYATLKAQGVHRVHLIEEAKRLLALRYFREHVLSMGQAARLSGMDYWSFTEFISANGVPVVDLDDEELAEEFDTVNRLAARLQEKH
ncbi:MAG: UPF0175 family protein [Chloroflexota bacterium]